MRRAVSAVGTTESHTASTAQVSHKIQVLLGVCVIALRSNEKVEPTILQPRSGGIR